MARTFCRIIEGNTPTLQDFWSAQALGRPRPRDSELQRLHDGVSVFVTLAQARRRARRFPQLGPYIVVLSIPEDAPILIERTISISSGHHTLWGEPELLLQFVETIIEVEK